MAEGSLERIGFFVVLMRGNLRPLKNSLGAKRTRRCVVISNFSNLTASVRLHHG